ncbi:MAG: peptide-methionine (S)-S-oxide reductase [Gallionellaceae bacterium]
MTTTETQQTAYLAGGCFWGMEELVRQIPGVLATEAGYTGGDTPAATYSKRGQGHIAS